MATQKSEIVTSLGLEAVVFGGLKVRSLYLGRWLVTPWYRVPIEEISNVKVWVSEIV